MVDGAGSPSRAVPPVPVARERPGHFPGLSPEAVTLIRWAAELRGHPVVFEWPGRLLVLGELVCRRPFVQLRVERPPEDLDFTLSSVPPPFVRNIVVPAYAMRNRRRDLYVYALDPDDCDRLIAACNDMEAEHHGWRFDDDRKPWRSLLLAMLAKGAP